MLLGIISQAHGAWGRKGHNWHMMEGTTGDHQHLGHGTRDGAAQEDAGQGTQGVPVHWACCVYVLVQFVSVWEGTTKGCDVWAIWYPSAQPYSHTSPPSAEP